MHPLIISTGSSQQLISSGIVIQFNHQPIEFFLDLPDFPIKIIMDFKNSNDDTTLHLIPTVINESTIKLELYNYNNPLGSGSSKPLKIADYQGKHIYLNYRVFALNETSDKTVHYTFYISEVLV